MQAQLISAALSDTRTLFQAVFLGLVPRIYRRIIAIDGNGLATQGRSSGLSRG